MDFVAADVEIGADAQQIYDELGVARRRTLVGPEDDMWATLADLAEPHVLVVQGEIAGCCSIDDGDRLLLFYVRDEFEEVAPDLFVHVVEQMAIVAAMPSTVDPAFLSMSLTAGGGAKPVALMFDHVAAPASSRRTDVRLATVADHGAAVAFDQVATDAPRTFLEPFLADRIDSQELYLVEVDEQIVATGECRVDGRTSGYAHLGLVVRSDLRGQGVGTRLMHTLTEVCRAQGLEPLCSTEPSNLAAQRVIRRAGFRSRHRVFRVALTGAS